jgi:alpha/beta superfamily hydrolase
MVEPIRLPGARDVRASLDTAGRRDSVVVACPPHPQMGGDSTDSRLREVSDALGDRGIDCLRPDYGPWDGGRGEQADVRNALAWGREHYASAGLFGYSFGGAVALLATAEARGGSVERLAADHFYVGQRGTAAGLVAAFLAAWL